MTTPRPHPHRPRSMPGMFLTFAGLALLVTCLAAMFENEQRAWSILSELIGASILLTGVFDLIAFARSPARNDWSEASGAIALVLAGGILCGGGWGAAIGLGILGASGLFVAGRRNANDDGVA